MSVLRESCAGLIYFGLFEYLKGKHKLKQITPDNINNIEKVNNLITILHPINDLKKITFIPQQLNKTKEKVIFITKEFEKIKDELYKDLKI